MSQDESMNESSLTIGGLKADRFELRFRPGFSISLGLEPVFDIVKLVTFL